MKQQKKKNLTLRERKLIAGIAAGLTVSEAARRAGYAKSTIDARIHEIIGRSRVQKAIDQIMEGMGINDEHLLDAMKAGLEATKLIPSGKFYIEVPDFTVRHRFLETVLYLKVYIANKKRSPQK